MTNNIRDERIQGGLWRFVSVAGWVFVALLCFLFTLAPTGGVDGQTTGGRIVCICAMIVSLVMAVRVLVSRVALHSESLLSTRAWSRARVVPRAEIEKISLEVVDSKITGDVVAPVITLQNGKELVLRQLARYGTKSGKSKGATDVELMNTWLSSGKPES